MSIETSTSVREVDGYRLVQRIGAGGYGEVWRADAPGGLSKAVKLVFGFHDEARASRELKALNRIKDLRHPFLLSLERIEVIDAQLVVVTELADCCLKDRFDECRKEGLPGIPREELLRYLADSAEALDYMTEVHSLQHLDVKPENLLVVGNHAKVADFGLVKSIQDVTASMMAGLTPLYASPEVFNDQPSRQSDQYSLAIVYQEMLTGTLPFPGRNLAQLTAQHLNSPPRLNTLPPRDRDILSKALAKKPNERYRSCAEMVKALIEADSIAHLPQVRSGSVDQDESSKTDTKTINCNDTKSSDPSRSSGEFDPETIRMDRDSQQWQARSSHVWEEITPRKQNVLPPVSDDRTQRELRPSVVLGIGGLGSRIIRHFVDRRLELVGTHAEQHWCRCVAIDTDANDLVQSTGQLGAAAGTPSLSTVEMPLRRPQAYRNLSRHLTKSMSRRWLYNIPLSLKTEGMRPLGRLAFADHAGRLREQIRDAVADATDLARGNIDPHNEHFSWQEKPRIVLVMSSSGGTGSGMVWDAFALAQEVVQEFGGSADDVSLWLVHATPSGTEQQDLARCNTYACLRELFHFQVTGEYPGDPVTKIPPQRWTEKISKQITLFETGGSQSRNVPVDIHDLADLLYMNVYEGREVAQRSRDSEESSNDVGPSVSAWAFAGKALCSSGHLDLAAARYTMELLRRWHGTGHGEKEQRKLAHLNDSDRQTSTRADHYQKLLDLRSAKIFQDCEFRLETVIDMVTQVVEDEIGARPEDYFSETIGRFANEIGGSRIPPTSAEMTIQMLDSLDQLIGTSNMEAEPGKLISVSLHSEIAPHIRQIAAHYQKKVLEQIHEILNESSFRVRGVKQLAAVVDERLCELEDKVRAMGDRTEQEVEKVRTALFPVIHQAAKRGARGGDRLNLSELRSLWLNYALLRTHGVIVLATCQVFQHLRTAIMRDNMWIKNTIVSLEMAEMKARERMALDDTSLMEDPKLLEKLLVLENQIDDILNSEHGGLSNLLHEERNGVDKLIAVMMECGKDLARRNASKEGSESQFLSSLQDGPDWKQRVASSNCRLTQLGPAVSRLMFMPESVADNSTVTTSAPHLAGSSPLGTKLPKVIWMESGGSIPLREAARLLIDNRPDYVPVADRLLTRADVHWAEL